MSLKLGDVEVAPNYFLALFRDRKTRELRRWERHDDVERGEPRDALRAMLKAHTVVGFNWLGFDFAMVQAYLAGFDNERLKEVCDWIIESRDPLARWRVLDHFGLPRYEFSSIDIMPVLPLTASLKVYAARARSMHIQDLPYHPSDHIDEPMRDETLAYCELDLDNTELLFDQVRGELKLRRHLSEQHGIDFLSKGDAQIAEGVMRTTLGNKGVTVKPMKAHERPKPPFIYTPPSYLHFHSALLGLAFGVAKNTPYQLDTKGDLAVPHALTAVPVVYDGMAYRMGIGGLHSSEKAMTIRRKPGESLFFADFASYYPMLILTNNWYAEKIGPAFTEQYRELVEQRLKDKAIIGKCKKRLAELETEREAIRAGQA